MGTGAEPFLQNNRRPRIGALSFSALSLFDPARFLSCLFLMGRSTLVLPH
jgi:hypothetical protein